MELNLLSTWMVLTLSSVFPSLYSSLRKCRNGVSYNRGLCFQLIEDATHISLLVINQLGLFPHRIMCVWPFLAELVYHTIDNTANTTNNYDHYNKHYESLSIKYFINIPSSGLCWSNRLSSIRVYYWYLRFDGIIQFRWIKSYESLASGSILLSLIALSTDISLILFCLVLGNIFRLFNNQFWDINRIKFCREAVGTTVLRIWLNV